MFPEDPINSLAKRMRYHRMCNYFGVTVLLLVSMFWLGVAQVLGG